MPQSFDGIEFRREGLTILQESEEDLADLIFVHGLNGDPRNTWTSRSSPNHEFCWIAELPKRLRNVRVMSFGYDANFRGGSNNLMGIRDHAQALLVHVRNYRTGTLSRRPLVFLCHSLGGLLIKQALISSAKKDNYEAIYQSTVAIFFFGTPHRGSKIVDSGKVTLLESIAKVANYAIPENLRSALEPGSRELFAINDDFSDVKRAITVVNFYEQKKSEKINALVVDPDSAIMHHPREDNIALMRTHQELVRYESADDDTFKLVVETIKAKLSGILAMPAEHDAEELNILRSSFVRQLTFPESEERITEIQMPHRRTLGWLWNEDTPLADWRRKSRGLFWTTGKPGSGKSTLAKEIYEQLLYNCPKDTVVISFFFKNGGTFLQRSARGMLRFFLSKILQQSRNAQNNVLFTFRRKGFASLTGQDDWSINELKKMLLSLLNMWKASMNLVLVVDALDECQDLPVQKLLDLFQELSAPPVGVPVKVWFSSRKLPTSLRHPGFRLEDMTSKDISNYVEDNLHQFAGPGENEMLQELKTDIIERADGIFLWVRLLIERLEVDSNDGNLLSDYKLLLSYIPNELTKLYEDLLTRVPEHYHEERDKLLGIVLCSRRKMSLREISIAMGLGKETIFPSYSKMIESPSVRDDGVMIKRIASRCGGLVEVKNLGGGKTVVQFIHQSVNDFLQDKEGEDGFRGHGSKVSLKGHVTLAESCIRYCVFPELSTFSQQLRSLQGSGVQIEKASMEKKYPFLDYAVSYWMDHCEEAEELGAAQTKEIVRFEKVGVDAFEAWVELHNYCSGTGRVFTDDTTLFLVAVMFGLKEYAFKRLEKGLNPNTPVKYFGHFLHVAAMSGKTDILKILLEYGADINAVGGHFHTALQAAAFGGSVEAATVLLNAGADLFLSGGDDHDALCAAAFHGNDNVLNLILEKHREKALEIGYIDGALQMAAATGRPSLVEKLISYGADPDERFFMDESVLFWAIFSCSEDTIKVLVEADADVNTNLIYSGLTILHWVSLYGSEDTARLLLNKRADLEVTDHNGSTPLHWAASNLRESVLAVLLDAGADCNAPNNYGMTPLHFACAQAGFEQVQALISAGADTDTCDIMRFSILHYAALNASPTVLKALLAASTEGDLHLDIDHRDMYGRKPIHIAAEFGCLKSLKFLAEVTGEDEEPDDDGRTILHAAARNNYVEVLSYWLKNHVDIWTVDNAGMTPLHQLFTSPGKLPHLTYLPSLVDQLRKNLQASEKEEKRNKKKPRHRKYATNRWMEVQLGVNKSVTDSTMKAKIKLLVDFGVDVNVQDDNGNTALHLACWQGDLTAIEALLAMGARCDLIDRRGFLPFDTASSEDARKLLEKAEKGTLVHENLKS